MSEDALPPYPTPPFPMRLQKFLARAGVASRRKSEDLMTAGRVTVNGCVVSELGAKVDPACDIVCVDGAEVRLGFGPVYLMLNKPAGYLTTMSDPFDRPCVASLVPNKLYPGLYPVGRLDLDTTGLLLFTTDGDLGQRVLHPSHHVEKRYRACVDGIPSEAELDRLRQGIELDDGPCQPAACVLERVSGDAGEGACKDSAEVVITITEGRKRQVKRMFAAIGHPVLRLSREAFGPLVVDGLPLGEWRMLTDDEIEALKSC